ncbi:MAG: tetratricopeptide repeat protein [Candidatus Kapaibacterium sp.]|nr:MAG: tetratricopeptide repeat protein [Candidatus Kapabacteria bacterium]
MKMLHTVSTLCTGLALAASVLAFQPRTLWGQDAPPNDAPTTYRRTGGVNAENLGVRYLKLGNSYREARNYDLAQYYIKRGIDMVRGGRSGTYWEAVGYEYLGLLYRDMGDRQLALEYLRTAASLYDRIVTMRNGQGSDDALRAVIADVEQGASAPPPSMSAQNSMAMATPPPVSATDTRLQDENTRLQNENRMLQSKISELEGRIKQLESSSVMSLKSSSSLDMSECKRELEATAKYRESTLWMNGFAPLDFGINDRAVRLQGGNARVDGTVIVGYLKRGESTKIEINVPIGQYLILGDACTQKARDLDVRIINSQGVVLERKDIRFNPNEASAGQRTDSSSTVNQSNNGQQNQQQNQQQNTSSQTSGQNQTQTQSTDTSAQPIETLSRKPNTREALAKIGWSNEYGGTHTFLVTMYDCDNEGAYFCFLIGKK